MTSPAKPQVNLTFASLPLSFMGSNLPSIIQSDQSPVNSSTQIPADLEDVQHDIVTIARLNPNVNWGWYQQGYDAETAITGPLNASYIVHHNGPQYFGYVGDNTTEQTYLHGLGDFFNDIAHNNLPAAGGVFYVRGGYANNDHLVPLVPNAAEKADFAGNDDHPGYSDAFIAEAQVADAVNAIANSPYWNESAIIITYDETDGLYDHAPFDVRSWDQNNVALAGGPRIPTIVISPFSATHTISHAYSEHSSVIKFIDELFRLVPLADLPDEQRARTIGQTELGQSNLGPADDQVNPMGDLTEAFDNDRLLGNAPPLPASYAMISNPHEPAALRPAGLLGAQHHPDRLPERAEQPAVRSGADRLQPAPRHRPGHPDLGFLEAVSATRRAGQGTEPPAPSPHCFHQGFKVYGMRLDWRSALLVAAGLAGMTPAAKAGATLDNVRHAGTVGCGVVSELPEYNKEDLHGALDRLGLEICKAIAVAALGDAAHMVPKSFPVEQLGAGRAAEGRGRRGGGRDAERQQRRGLWRAVRPAGFL